MKVLVTGATGFVGNYVVCELAKRGVEVIATGRSEAKANKLSWADNVQFIPFDIAGELSDSLFNFFLKPDKVIHLAWSGLPNYKQLFHFEKELPTQYLFLKKLIDEGVQDITITGTCFEYGMQEGKLAETLTTLPCNPYAFAKDTLRKQLAFLQSKNDFEMKWVRLFYMHGKGQNANSILAQLQTAIDRNAPSFNMSKGEQIRDYLTVEEVASNIVTIALQNEETGIINNCSGAPITIKKLVEEFINQSQANISLNLGYYPYNDYEPFSFWGDNTKLLKIKFNESNRAI